jgi:hypothetical protein
MVVMDNILIKKKLCFNYNNNDNIDNNNNNNQ